MHYNDQGRTINTMDTINENEEDYDMANDHNEPSSTPLTSQEKGLIDGITNRLCVSKDIMSTNKAANQEDSPPTKGSSADAYRVYLQNIRKDYAARLPYCAAGFNSNGKERGEEDCADNCSTQATASSVPVPPEYDGFSSFIDDLAVYGEAEDRERALELCSTQGIGMGMYPSVDVDPSDYYDDDDGEDDGDDESDTHSLALADKTSRIMNTFQNYLSNIDDETDINDSQILFVPTKTQDAHHREGLYKKRGSEGGITAVPLRNSLLNDGEHCEALKKPATAKPLRDGGGMELYRSWNLHFASDSMPDLENGGGGHDISPRGGQRYNHVPVLHSKKFKNALAVICACVICLIVGATVHISRDRDHKKQEQLGLDLHWKPKEDALPHHVIKDPFIAESSEKVMPMGEFPHNNKIEAEPSSNLESSSQQQMQPAILSPVSKTELHPIQEAQTDHYYKAQHGVGSGVSMFESNLPIQIIEEYEAKNPSSGNSETGTKSNEEEVVQAFASPEVSIQATEGSLYAKSTSDTIPKSNEEAVTASSASMGSEQVDADFTPSDYAPTWFDKRQGWVGTTYIDAIAFCASQESRIPCPYEAICPEGPGSVPTGGNLLAAEAWSPIMDVPNGWVSIGSTEALSCKDYNSVHSNPPLWGVLRRTDEGTVRHAPHIMCCRAPPSGEINVPAHIDSQSSSSVTVQLDTKTKPASTHTVIDSNEQDVMDKLHPVWFGRKHGYHGTTHQEAAEFCKDVGDYHLCPREAYCPDGPGNSKPLFLQKEAFQGEQWAPVADTPGASGSMRLGDDSKSHGTNRWVLVGTVNDVSWSTCMNYDQIHRGESPHWGIDSTHTELKENILCCQNPKNLLQEQQFAKSLDPIWLDHSHGWTGGSHDDAMEFCEALGRMKLCPYTAYCAHGPGQPVMGGHTQDFNAGGEQWAPVYDKANHWVMIGQRYENSATTCMDDFQLDGSEPYWGLTEERKEIKSNIMCCSF